MIIKNNKTRWGALAILLHWVSAIVIIAMFALGLWMDDLTYYDSWYHKAPFVHKSVGMLLAVMIAIRVVWRIVNVTPKELSDSKLENLAAKLAHLALYILIIALIATGYAVSASKGHPIDVFGWFLVPAMFGTIDAQLVDILGDLHELLSFSIIFLAILHAIAALKHHFINKDDVLKRMVKLKH